MTASPHASADTIAIAIESSEVSHLLEIRILLRTPSILRKQTIEAAPAVQPPDDPEMPEDESNYECG